MERVMKKNSNLLTCIAELVIGILLLINPTGFTRGIIIALGILLALQGIGFIVGYIREKPQTASEGNLLAKGLLLTCGGLFCMFHSGWFIAVFPVLTTLYGVMTLVTAFGKLQWTADLLRMKHKYWFIALINALLSLVLAILIMTNPFSSTTVLWVFIGISMIVESVVDVVTLVFEKK
ncbi:MAG: DUF308 domain-containing protein [Clostridia bacterium]|nr:DUF308 domain-containing protein [Clostridia bacterium]